MHKNSLLLFEQHAVAHIPAGAEVLEIGPDGRPSSYARTVTRPVDCWDTLDIDPSGRFSNVDASGLTHLATDPYDFPVTAEAYDVVISGQVVEHVPRIWDWVREVARVCRPGGLVMLIAPVSWPYHEAPVDCWRVYADGMQALLEEADLQVLLSVTDGLEEPDYPNLLPGESNGWSRTPGAVEAQVKNALRWPRTHAIDTIGIARKR